MVNGQNGGIMVINSQKEHTKEGNWKTKNWYESDQRNMIDNILI